MTKKAFRLEIGGSNFKEFIDNKAVLVDKTALIHSIIEDSNKALLITRPRRWGKTLNMSMLEYFFSISSKPDGSADEDLHRKNCALFSKMAIGQYPEVIKEHCGKHPVIFVTFKDVKAHDFEGVELQTRHLIYTLYLNHEYLLKSPALSEAQKSLFRKFLTKSFDAAELNAGINILSHMLYLHFNKKVILLIDEYDSPMNDWYARMLAKEGERQERDHDYLDKVSTLFRNILGAALKDNPYLKKAVITGILRIAKASLFSGLNNLGENTILDHDYSKYFGFTEDDVEKLLQDTEIDYDAQTISQMQTWYNGYNIGGLTIYNPWSIMNWIKSQGKFHAYWVGTASTSLIENALILDKFQTQLQDLIQGKTVTMIADPKMVFSDITSSPQALFNLLLFSGYLTTEKSQARHGGEIYECDLRIPNAEVKTIFTNSVELWIKNKLENNHISYDIFLQDLLSGNIQEFTKKLKGFLEISTSFYAMGPKNAELFYNGFMIGLMTSTHPNYIIEPEKESGEGRADLILIPKPTAKHLIAVIMEFKSVDPLKNLSSSAEEALNQVISKNYAAKIKAYKYVKKTISIGLAFSGKNVEIASKLSSE